MANEVEECVSERDFPMSLFFQSPDEEGELEDVVTGS